MFDLPLINSKNNNIIVFNTQKISRRIEKAFIF